MQIMHQQFSQIGSSTELLLHKLCDKNKIDEAYEFKYVHRKLASNQIEAGIIEGLKGFGGRGITAHLGERMETTGAAAAATAA